MFIMSEWMNELGFLPYIIIKYRTVTYVSTLDVYAEAVGNTCTYIIFTYCDPQIQVDDNLNKMT